MIQTVIQHFRKYSDPDSEPSDVSGENIFMVGIMHYKKFIALLQNDLSMTHSFNYIIWVLLICLTFILQSYFLFSIIYGALIFL